MSFKKVEKEENFNSYGQNADAYKFKVEMIVSLFAANDLQASEQLDTQGGFVISRKVELISKTPIHVTQEDGKE